MGFVNVSTQLNKLYITETKLIFYIFDVEILHTYNQFKNIISGRI